MRQLLVEQLPTLAAVYHLTPADVDDLTIREARAFLEQLPRFAHAGDPVDLLNLPDA